MPTVADLIDWVHDARERTFELVADLSDEQLMGPPLAIVNPLLWEIGHVA
jgi:iron(II)-dependent oxidoreductase